MQAVNYLLAALFCRLNIICNTLGAVLLAPLAHIPGWLSNTIISAVMGVVLLVLFKYTSNQKAIGRVRDGVKADMLALKLFKDELPVTFASQGRLFLGAFKLLFYSLCPLAVMILPVVFVLAQMGAWYQLRPLAPGEKTVVTMQLNGSASDDLPPVEIVGLEGAAVTVGPVRIPAQREISWEIEAQKPVRTQIVFAVHDQQVEKDLVIGDGFCRLSPLRPGWKWSDILLFPLEKPFHNDDTVHSISITYPERDSLTCGTDWWVIYFFVVSLICALIFKPFLNVRL